MPISCSITGNSNRWNVTDSSVISATKGHHSGSNLESGTIRGGRSHYPGVAALWATADIGRNGGRALHLHAVLGCLLRSISADKKNRQRPAQFQARI